MNIILNELLESQIVWEKVLKANKATKEEEIILSKNINYSYLYSKLILKARFHIAENLIAKNDYYAYNYAIDIAKGRLKQAENLLVLTGKIKEYFFCIMKFNHE